jgi:hypothetical protein
MSVHFSFAIFAFTNNQKGNESYLKEAKKDGHECFMCMPTRKDMNMLAEICQTLAKFPNTNTYGPESLTSKKDLFDALDYMHYAIFSASSKFSRFVLLSYFV